MDDKDGRSKTKEYKFKGDGGKTWCADWAEFSDKISRITMFIAGTIGTPLFV